mgnify:CR=1 FL=1
MSFISAIRCREGLEVWGAAGRMPESRDFNPALRLSNAVNDPVSVVDDFPNARIIDPGNHPTHFGERSQQPGFADQFPTEAFGSGWVVKAYVTDDFLQILDGARRENNFEIHAGSCFSTSSRGMPSPRSSCANPSRIPAMNSISRAMSVNEASSGRRVIRSATICLLLMRSA